MHRSVTFFICPPFRPGQIPVLPHRYRLREDVTGEVMSDRVNYLFLELPNCSRARMPGASTLEKLCFALHNMHRLKEKPPGMEGSCSRSCLTARNSLN